MQDLGSALGPRVGGSRLGILAGGGNMFCSRCGKELAGDQAFCPGCGTNLIQDPNVSPKSRLAKSLLAWYLGWLGVHRFYLGKIGTGVLMLLTFGGLGIWTIIDFIIAVTGNMKDKDGKLIKKW
jgi:hypothetical protein